MPEKQIENSAKKRIAFLGGGAHIIANYRALIETLCEDYDITIYSEFYFEVKNDTKYRLRTVPDKNLSRRLRWLVFAWMMVRDHVVRPYDLIHSHSTLPSGFFGTIISKLFRVPIVVSLDAAEASAVPEIEFGDLLSPKRTRINKWVINRADEVIVLTEFALNEVRTNLMVTRPVNVIPRGVDMQKFVFSEKPVHQPLNLLNVAYLHPVKDQETLLRCFALIRQKKQSILTHFGLDFIGGKTQLLAKNMGIAEDVKFSGFLSNDQLPQVYAGADILLHTSRFESQAVVVCEAMASGVLVCGTHVGLAADLAGGCCITVAPGDAAGLADKVLELLDSPDEMARLRRNAYAWVSKHDLHWTVARHKEIYEKFFVN